jgi:hypothetical protein
MRPKLRQLLDRTVGCADGEVVYLLVGVKDYDLSPENNGGRRIVLTGNRRQLWKEVLDGLEDEATEKRRTKSPSLARMPEVQED